MSSIKSPNADFELKEIDIEIVEILLNLLKEKKETISYDYRLLGKQAVAVG